MKYKTIILMIVTTLSLNATADTKYFAQVSKEITKKSVNLVNNDDTSILNSCNEIKLNNNLNVGNGIYTINQNGNNIEVYCNMETKEGGWTLIASLADDNNDYWIYKNKNFLSDGFSQIGNVNAINQDFQSLAFHTLKGNEVLFTKSTNQNEYLYYPNILNDQTMASKYPKSNIKVGEFSASDSFGNWWQVCGTTYQMSLVTPDSDVSVWSQSSWGFIWRSSNNNGCSYDDVQGGLSSSYTAITAHNATEIGWTLQGFYTQNFKGKALQVWVR